MNKKKNRKKQGFTLIEVIAVLVIIAILAAAAVPRFLSLIEDARQKAREGALASGQSACSLVYGKYCLVNEKAPSAADVAADATAAPPAGDFTWAFDGTTAGQVTITVTDQGGDTATDVWILP
jgi:prepilin-type N-terminal cleavage/methylation domain-containing protein